MKSVLTLVVLIACPLAGFAFSSSQRARGARVFAESGCTQCHSIHNTGGSRGPDLSNVGRRLTEDQLRRQIVNGSKIMPAFGDALQTTDLTDLISYLRSCRDKRR